MYITMNKKFPEIGKGLTRENAVFCIQVATHTIASTSVLRIFKNSMQCSRKRMEEGAVGSGQEMRQLGRQMSDNQSFFHAVPVLNLTLTLEPKELIPNY